MSLVRLESLPAAHKCNVFRFASRDGSDKFRLVKDQKRGPMSYHFDLFANGVKVKTVVRREIGPQVRRNIECLIPYNGHFQLDLIDLGDKAGSGAGFIIMNILAKIAQEQASNFTIYHTCNMGLVHMLERVSDFRFQDIAWREFFNFCRLGRPTVKLSADKLKSPKFIYDEGIPDFQQDGYWPSPENPLASILFAKTEDETDVRVDEIEPCAKDNFKPDVPIGTSLRHFTFNPDGTLALDGRKIGYPVALNFQMFEIVGENPRPVDGVMVEAD